MNVEMNVEMNVIYIKNPKVTREAFPQILPLPLDGLQKCYNIWDVKPC